MIIIPLTHRLTFALAFFLALSYCLFPADYSVLSNNTDSTPTQVSEETLKSAQAQYAEILLPDYKYADVFNNNTLWDKEKSQQLIDRLGGISNSITINGTAINYTYFDRKSDKIIIMAPGFGFTKEHLLPMVAMMQEIDIACLDQRGHGASKSDNEIALIKPKTWIDWAKDSISQMLFKIKATDIGLGTVEVDDVIHLINHIKTTHPNKEVFGLGMCYSAFIFTKAAALYKKKHNTPLFDRLILYGALPTTEGIFSRLADAPKFVRKLTQKWNEQLATIIPIESWVKFIKSLGKDLIKPINEMPVKIETYLNEIGDSIPVVLIQGFQDEIIKMSEFTKIWEELKSQTRFALVTPNGHLDDHLKNKTFFARMLNICTRPIGEVQAWFKGSKPEPKAIEPIPNDETPDKK